MKDFKEESDSLKVWKEDLVIQIFSNLPQKYATNINSYIVNLNFDSPKTAATIASAHQAEWKNYSRATKECY